MTRSARNILLTAAWALFQVTPAQVNGQASPGATASTAVQNLFAQAQQEESAGDTGAAINLYKDVVEQAPTGPLAAQAQFRIGLLEEQEEDYFDAFEAYQQLVDNYPKSPDFDKAIQQQFRIATKFLEGERLRVLMIPTFTAEDRAREMFEQIIVNAPFSDFAPLSQFNIGLAREKQGDLEKAIAAYQTVVERYPEHDVADDAQYQIAYLYQQAARAGSYDASAKQKAIEAYEDFLFQFPDSEKIAQARENLAGLEQRVTEDALEIAKFYDKQQNYKAAALYYRDVIKSQPNTPAAAEAQARLDKIQADQGDQALKIGTDNPDTGSQGKERRKMRSQIDTRNRPDYAGPPAPARDNEETEVRRNSGPALRSTPVEVAPDPEFEPNLPD